MRNHRCTAVFLSEARKTLSKVRLSQPLCRPVQQVSLSLRAQTNPCVHFFADYIARETAWKKTLIYPESLEPEYTLMWVPLQ